MSDALAVVLVIAGYLVGGFFTVAVAVYREPDWMDAPEGDSLIGLFVFWWAVVVAVASYLAIIAPMLRLLRAVQRRGARRAELKRIIEDEL